MRRESSLRITYKVKYQYVKWGDKFIIMGGENLNPRPCILVLYLACIEINPKMCFSYLKRKKNIVPSRTRCTLVIV